MIPKINRILYATDLSLNASYVFRYALSSAEKHDAMIDILHVVQPEGGLGFVMPAAEKESINRKLNNKIEVLTKEEGKENPSYVNRDMGIHLKVGDPTEVILQTVEELKPDVLLMGTHSKGIVEKAILGSVATKVLQRIRIPVYIIPIPDLQTPYVN